MKIRFVKKDDKKGSINLITLFQFYFDAPHYLHGRLDLPIGAPPQSSRHPGYRNPGLVCYGCRTWCSSHTPSKDSWKQQEWKADIPNHPSFHWVALAACFNLNQEKRPPWTHYHQATFLYHLIAADKKLMPSRLFRGLTVLHHFGFQIGQPHVVAMWISMLW